MFDILSGTCKFIFNMRPNIALAARCQFPLVIQSFMFLLPPPWRQRASKNRKAWLGFEIYISSILYI